MKEVRREIGTGDSAIAETVKHMIRLAKRDSTDTVIRKIVNPILAKCNNNQLCLAKECFNYLLKFIPYKFDHENVLDWVNLNGLNPKGVEFLVAPVNLFTEVKEGDCDCLSTALASLFLACGLSCRFRVIAWKSNEYTHVYSEVGNTQIMNFPIWIPADPVIGQFGIEKVPTIREKSWRIDI